jgi:hypothetical protein
MQLAIGLSLALYRNERRDYNKMSRDYKYTTEEAQSVKKHNPRWFGEGHAIKKQRNISEKRMSITAVTSNIEVPMFYKVIVNI